MTLDAATVWFGGATMVAAVYLGGALMGYVFSLRARKYSGPPLRWVEEHGISKYEEEEN